MLKLTIGDRHYVRTKFRPNPRGSGIFCVDLTWNDPPASSISGFRAMQWRLEVKRDLSIHQLQYTFCWVVCSAVCYHSTLLLPGFLIRRTRCSKNCMEIWTIFSVVTWGRGWTASEACRDHHKARGLRFSHKWESGELGAKALQNAVFYYNRKNFCLWGCVECRELKITQLECAFEPNGYIYHEYVSKNRPGTYQTLHLQTKRVPIYACSDAGEQCRVFLLDLYLKKLLWEAIQKDVFYVCPLQEAPADPNAPWYSAVPIRKHTLNNMVEVMCERAGIQGHKLNSSLWATTATELHQADVPKKLIQERTGHQSLKALQVLPLTNSRLFLPFYPLQKAIPLPSNTLQRSTSLVLISDVLQLRVLPEETGS